MKWRKHIRSSFFCLLQIVIQCLYTFKGMFLAPFRCIGYHHLVLWISAGSKFLFFYSIPQPFINHRKKSITVMAYHIFGRFTENSVKVCTFRHFTFHGNPTLVFHLGLNIVHNLFFNILTVIYRTIICTATAFSKCTFCWNKAKLFHLFACPQIMEHIYNSCRDFSSVIADRSNLRMEIRCLFHIVKPGYNKVLRNLVTQFLCPDTNTDCNIVVSTDNGIRKRLHFLCHLIHELYSVYILIIPVPGVGFGQAMFHYIVLYRLHTGKIFIMPPGTSCIQKAGTSMRLVKMFHQLLHGCCIINPHIITRIYYLTNTDYRNLYLLLQGCQFLLTLSVGCIVAIQNHSVKLRTPLEVK